MQKMATCLWADSEAEEMAKFYTSVFKDSKILGTTYFGPDNPPGKPAGSVLTVLFQMNGQEFMTVNGGPVFKHSPAMSLMVYCKSQAEIDEFWEKLCHGGSPSQCGWLTDRFGVSWQIVPDIMNEMMLDKDKKKTERVMQAVFQMTKLDIQKIKKAYEG